MKFASIVLLVAVAAQYPLHARIGESDGELRKRYGKAVPRQRPPVDNLGYEERQFLFDRWYVVVFLIDDRSVYEEFQELRRPEAARANPQEAELATTLSQDTIDLVLGANARGKQWQPVDMVTWQGTPWRIGTTRHDPPRELVAAWRLGDETLFAIHQVMAMNPTVTVFSQEWVDYQSRGRDKAIKKSGL